MRSVTEPLLDSSVVLAFIQGERHYADEDQVLAGATISGINLAGVIAVLLRKGVPEEVATVAEIEAMAREKGCTPAQLALGWLLA